MMVSDGKEAQENRMVLLFQPFDAIRTERLVMNPPARRLAMRLGPFYMTWANDRLKAMRLEKCMCALQLQVRSLDEGGMIALILHDLRQTDHWKIDIIMQIGASHRSGQTEKRGDHRKGIEGRKA